jgi:hypothetical protein
MKSRHTCYNLDFLRRLASDQEDNIPLTGIDIVVLEEEDLVNAVLL